MKQDSPIEPRVPNKDRIALLVEALRSGQYPQTQEHLRDETGFCCLGVATDVYLKENPGHFAWQEDTGNYRDLGEDALPPTKVADWYGIAVDPYLDLKGTSFEDDLAGLTGHMTVYGCAEATSCNDSLGLSLEQIGEAFENTFL